MISRIINFENKEEEDIKGLKLDVIEKIIEEI